MAKPLDPWREMPERIANRDLGFVNIGQKHPIFLLLNFVYFPIELVNSFHGRLVILNQEVGNLTARILPVRIDGSQVVS
jgi:hypothetical protein